MRLARYSISFGVLACLGLPFNPPIIGCLGNPLFYLFAGFAGLGLICGTLGLIGPTPGRALAGMALCVLSPFAGWALGIRSSSGSGRNEPYTLGDMRTVAEAEEVFTKVNGGFYATPECLAAPTACVVGYPVNGPTFLDSQLASGHTKSGYKRRFIAGPPAPNGHRWSMTSFAYVAVPDLPGITGRRGFCIDPRGEICMTVQGEDPPVVDGRCVIDTLDKSSPCVPLR